MIGTLEVVVLDAPDIVRLSAFYRGLGGWVEVSADDDWIALDTPDGWHIALQSAPDHQPPVWPGQDRPQQAHLDLRVPDLEGGLDRALDLGGTLLNKNESWYTVADPAGHPFDLCQKDGHGPGVSLFAVTIDAPDGPALGRFYAELLGLAVAYEGPEGALVAGADGSVMFQQIGAAYVAPRWPDPAHPQQGHLDVAVDDLDGAEAQVLELGATRLPGSGGNWRVYADPAGHPFCLCARVSAG